ncbi:MauE/DoxX family redox-associated membrane protein [Nocardioides terrisoli]|uniref:MauE/DoxX family redox-associated membrane protein n=1 Tax=Nocardioides terrisoli TaxID=3388267 RepID=UPI00287B7D5F|nr:MauE/DoxX family redox-associated membrane protein [Nocardioides marmorisolisilvae]
MLRWVGLVARLLVGGVWIAAGVIKLPHPEASVAAVRAYQLLPLSTTNFVGHLLPIVEVLIGVVLVLGVLVRLGGVLSALLQLAFIIGISSVWARGIPIDCGCFGNGGATSWAHAKATYPWEIARDVGLFLVSAYMVVRPRTVLALDNLLFPPLEKGTPHVQEQP